jgi:hypothetical protein
MGKKLVRSVELNGEESKNLALIINSYGSGDHPYADGNSVKYFYLEYAIDCVKKAVDSNLSVEKQEIADNLLALLKGKEIDNLAEEVTAIFDSLATEIYYGMNFKMTLMENPEFVRQLQVIVNKAEFARASKTIKKIKDSE